MLHRDRNNQELGKRPEERGFSKYVIKEPKLLGFSAPYTFVFLENLDCNSCPVMLNTVPPWIEQTI